MDDFAALSRVRHYARLQGHCFALVASALSKLCCARLKVRKRSRGVTHEAAVTLLSQALVTMQVLGHGAQPLRSINPRTLQSERSCKQPLSSSSTYSSHLMQVTSLQGVLTPARADSRLPAQRRSPVQVPRRDIVRAAAEGASPTAASGSFDAGRGKVGTVSTNPSRSASGGEQQDSTASTKRPPASSETIKEAQNNAQLFLKGELSRLFDTGVRHSSRPRSLGLRHCRKCTILMLNSNR